MDAGDDGIEADVEQAVVAPGLESHDGEEQEAQPEQFGFGDREDVAIEEALEVAGHAAVAADHGQAEGHDRGEDHADDGVGGQGAAPLEGHDGEAHGQAEKRHGPGGAHGEDQAQRDAGEGGVADGIGEKCHAEVDDLDTHGGGHGGDEEEAEQGLLHEAHLQAIKRNHGNKRVYRAEIRHVNLPDRVQCRH